jgi:SnoaL-like protein
MTKILPVSLSATLFAAVLAGCGAMKPDTPSADATARIAALEARLNAVEDVQKIERLFRAYGYYFDKGLWHEATTLFTDDAVVEIAQRGVYRGRAGVERIYQGVFGRGKNCLPPNGLNNHLILQPIITLDAGGTTASGRARIIGMIAIRDGDFMLQEGLYNLKFRKDGGVWRIADLHYFGDMYLVMPEGLKKFAIPQSPAGTENPPDAPPSAVYQSWPGYYLPEFPYPNPVTGRTVDVAQCNAAGR